MRRPVRVYGVWTLVQDQETRSGSSARSGGPCVHPAGRQCVLAGSEGEGKFRPSTTARLFRRPLLTPRRRARWTTRPRRRDQNVLQGRGVGADLTPPSSGRRPLRTERVGTGRRPLRTERERPTTGRPEGGPSPVPPNASKFRAHPGRVDSRRTAQVPSPVRCGSGTFGAVSPRERPAGTALPDRGRPASAAGGRNRRGPAC